MPNGTTIDNTQYPTEVERPITVITILNRQSRMKNFYFFKKTLIAVCCLTFVLFCNSSVSAQSFDSIKISKQVAESLKQISSPKYATVAFSRIQGSLEKRFVNELIDYTNVAIVRSRGYKVIDRSKLQAILDEQQFNLTGLVSPDTYKELGKLLGVDLFLYGRYYNDVIVLKAIDVESSAIVWSDQFQLTDELSRKSVMLHKLSGKVITSLQTDRSRLKANKINQISFWNIQSDFDTNQITDFLSSAITKANAFQVIDRENLQLILEEQKLNMQNFIDEKQAKRMGELYGIDAFIYGTVTARQGQYVASLKLLNIYNGVIEWADLITFGDESETSVKQKKSNNLKKDEMVYIPAGSFFMGDNSGNKIHTPRLRIPLKAFYLDRTEVSNQEYYTFVKKFKHRSPPSWKDGQIPFGKKELPVVMVNWNDANRYCKSINKRLPSELEWEKAFRGGEGRTYPWEESKFNPNFVRTLESGILSPLAVNFPNRDISIYGIQHLAGNVREWTNSLLKPYPRSTFRSNKVKRERVIRGGSWALSHAYSVGWYRASSKPTYAWKDVGFRCARSAK